MNGVRTGERKNDRERGGKKKKKKAISEKE